MRTKCSSMHTFLCVQVPSCNAIFREKIYFVLGKERHLLIFFSLVGIAFGASCTLSLVEKVLSKAVAELPPYKTEVFKAVLEQLRWFAGLQIRNVAVSD